MSIGAAWERLFTEAPVATGWHSIRVLPGAAIPVRAAIRLPDKVPAMLFEVNSASVSRIVSYPDAYGFEVFPEIITPGPHGKVRICLVLLDASHRTEFSLLVDNVVASIATAASEVDAVQRLFERLKAWQRFMKEHRKGLSSEEQTGLFAELSFFLTLAARIGALESLEAWKGPSGGLRDFVLAKCEFEIKGSMASSASSFRVSHAAQLDESTAPSLVVCHMSLAHSDGGITLAELVEKARSTVTQCGPFLVRRADEALMEAGYMDMHADQYASRRLTIRSQKYFHIRDDFPRLKKVDLRRGIIDAAYIVDLAMCLPYEISEEAAFGILSGREE